MKNGKERFFIHKGSLGTFWPDWPILLWMILITLLIGLLAGFDSHQIIATFNKGWGYAAGEFALILLPSFILAAALEKQAIGMPESTVVYLAPFVSAGMICPDTAYAALSPMAKRKRLSLAFGAYAGFKLLFPAGPLIIATSLGVSDPSLFAYCFVVFIPVWAVGLIYSRIIESKLAPAKEQNSYQSSPSSFTSLLPFVLLMVLLASGVLFDLSFNPLLDYAVNPKGALMLTAALALFMIPKLERRDCIDIGILRTGSLLLLIGAASALSAFVTAIIPIAQIFTPQNSIMALISLFIMPALFKLLQGSSMSAFAAVGPVAAPIVVASEVSPIAAVLAICLGSFVAILPNDSFYWLIRRSVMKDESEFNVINILGCGSLLQAMIGLAILIAFQHIALG